MHIGKTSGQHLRCFLLLEQHATQIVNITSGHNPEGARHRLSGYELVTTAGHQCPSGTGMRYFEFGQYHKIQPAFTGYVQVIMIILPAYHDA